MPDNFNVESGYTEHYSFNAGDGVFGNGGGDSNPPRSSHSTIANLRMLNPHKFATYQFVKQYFSVSPNMFMNFTNPTDANDYSYNDIIHMIEPFLNEFKLSSKTSTITTLDEVNLPDTASQYNNDMAINSFNIIDQFGYYEGAYSYSQSQAKVNFHGSIFAAFVPIHTLSRVNKHSDIGYELDNQLGIGMHHNYSTLIYDANFYSTGINTGYIMDGGQKLTLPGGNTLAYIDSIEENTPWSRNHFSGDDYMYGGYNHNDSRINPRLVFNRVDNVNATIASGDVDMCRVMTMTKNSTNSVFKNLDLLMNGNLRNGITELERQYINATAIH